MKKKILIATPLILHILFFIFSNPLFWIATIGSIFVLSRLVYFRYITIMNKRFKIIYISSISVLTIICVFYISFTYYTNFIYSLGIALVFSAYVPQNIYIGFLRRIKHNIKTSNDTIDRSRDECSD